MDYVPLDANGDGVVESYGVDQNGDGLYELRYADLDGDGVFDTHTYDSNQNGYLEEFYIDVNEDGIPEIAGLDRNENGVPDAYDYGFTAPGSVGPTMSPVSMAMGNYGMSFGPGAEIVSDGNHDIVNTHLTPDGEVYTDRNGQY
jgi:hypothetical protein